MAKIRMQSGKRRTGYGGEGRLERMSQEDLECGCGKESEETAKVKVCFGKDSLTRLK